MPNSPKNPLSELLAKYGIDRRSLTRIKFGGVVGKQALVGIMGVVGLIAVVVKAESPYLLWGCGSGIFLLTIGTIISIAIHGHQHPLEATLEGGEIVVMQHLRGELAAKGMNQVPESSPMLEGIGKKPSEDAK